MYLLDTNVVSELRRAARADATVRAWAERTEAGLFWLSTISLLELDLGVLRIERRDAAQGALLRRWLEEQVVPRFAERMLAVDAAVARRCARLHVPDPRPDRDALIAATALVHGLTVVTRNEVDFVGTSVQLLNPWNAPAP
ncbi:MAG: type II toxin-antitoxin system VapC family toxin [Geminicoccaceae bacterium]